jgi:hypothetical protein
MGIRANALTDHKVPDFRNLPAVLSLLAPTMPAAIELRDYWRSVDSNYVDSNETWNVSFSRNPPEQDYLRYNGFGGLSVSFGEHVAQIHADCRWSGFVTMPPLQKVHAAAFLSIALALGGDHIVMTPDFDPVVEIALYNGGSLEDCINLLRQCWGAPHPITEVVTEDVEAYYRRKFPAWFVESLVGNG